MCEYEGLQFVILSLRIFDNMLAQSWLQQGRVQAYMVTRMSTYLVREQELEVTECIL
jgi:hypothetical protein